MTEKKSIEEFYRTEDKHKEMSKKGLMHAFIGNGPHQAKISIVGYLQSLKKLSQCLAIWERLTWQKLNKLCNTLKIIYNIFWHLNVWTFLKPRDLDQN